MRPFHELARGRMTGGEPLVGAAIGIGIMAEAAERGGADFLLALNAGRYRVMGAASIAAMLPLADANRFTDVFARREILDRVGIPVFFGAAACDPRLELGAFMAEVAQAGYHGVANFPTVTHFDGGFRQALEEAGLGYGREVAMLKEARRHGLVAFGYAKTRAEIEQVLTAEVDVVCLNFGWNAGGARSVAQAFTLEEAADRARRIFQQIRQARPATICVVEGGPIVNPDDMYRVCRDAKADGYVGGSTLDRLPLEVSVMQVTSAFKAVGALKEADQAQRREVARAARLAGVAGQSAAINALLDKLVRLAATSLPVLIQGERGLGRTALARAIPAIERRSGAVVVCNPGHESPGLEELLFGREADFGRVVRNGALETVRGSVIVLEANELPRAIQLRLADWLERGAFERLGGGRPVVAQARIVLVARPDGAARLEPELLRHFGASTLDVPPLRDRPEDIAACARLVLEAINAGSGGRGLDISADGIRALFAHSWPENARELRQVIEKAAIAADGQLLGSAEILAAIDVAAVEGPSAKPMAEKDWIVDALRRNRFRRGATAAFLGVSRKTLYNKMRRHGLLE